MAEFLFSLVAFRDSMLGGTLDFALDYFCAIFFVVVVALFWFSVFGAGFFRGILIRKIFAIHYVFEIRCRIFCRIQTATVFFGAYYRRLNRALAILFDSGLCRLYSFLPSQRADKLANKTCFAYCVRQKTAYSCDIFYEATSFASLSLSTIRRITSEKLIPSRLASALSHANCGFVNTMDRWMIGIRTSLECRWTNLGLDYSLVKRPA